jgi:hypothetical protein
MPASVQTRRKIASATSDVDRQCAKHGAGGQIEQEDGDARR